MRLPTQKLVRERRRWFPSLNFDARNSVFSSNTSESRMRSLLMFIELLMKFVINFCTELKIGILHYKSRGHLLFQLFEILSIFICYFDLVRWYWNPSIVRMRYIIYCSVTNLTFTSLI